VTNLQINRRGFLGAAGALGVGGALILSGCGSDSDGSGSNVNIANTGSTDTFVLQNLLTAKGYLKEQSVTAKTVNVSDGSKLTGAVMAGRSDAAIMTGFAQILPAIEKGADVRLIGGVSNHPIHSFYTAADSDLDDISELAGRSIGTGAPGALLAELALAAFNKAGVDSDSVTFVNIGASTDVTKAVAAGKVDAGVGFYLSEEQQKELGVRSVLDLWDYLPDFTIQAAFASRKAIKSKGDQISRTLAGYLQTFQYVSSRESKKDYLAAALKVSGMTEAQALSWWSFYQDHPYFSQDLQLTAERIDLIQDLNIASGTQSTKLDFDDVVDLSLAEKAVTLVG